MSRDLNHTKTGISEIAFTILELEPEYIRVVFVRPFDGLQADFFRKGGSFSIGDVEEFAKKTYTIITETFIGFRDMCSTEKDWVFRKGLVRQRITEIYKTRNGTEDLSYLGETLMKCLEEEIRKYLEDEDYKLPKLSDHRLDAVIQQSVEMLNNAQKKDDGTVNKTGKPKLRPGETVSGCSNVKNGNPVFSKSKAIYLCTTGETTTIFSKESQTTGSGFFLKTIVPYRDFLWDHDCVIQVSEKNMQELMPCVIKMINTLYTTVETNENDWRRMCTTFKSCNPGVREDLSESLMAERIYESLAANSVYFRSNQYYSYAKAWLRVIILEILCGKEFSSHKPAAEWWETEQEYERKGYTIMDVSPYTPHRRKELFELMSEKQKLKLKEASDNCYGSQFNELLNHYFRK